MAKQSKDNGRIGLWEALPTGKVPDEWIQIAKASRDARGLPVIDLKYEAERFIAWHDEKGSAFKDWKRAFTVTWAQRAQIMGAQAFHGLQGNAEVIDEQKTAWRHRHAYEDHVWRSPAGKRAAEKGFCCELQAFLNEEWARAEKGKQDPREPGEQDLKRMELGQTRFENRRSELMLEFRGFKARKKSDRDPNFGAYAGLACVKLYNKKWDRERELRKIWRNHHACAPAAEPLEPEMTDQGVLF